VVLGNGTSAVQFVAPGTTGNLLTSNGTTWTSAAPPAGGVTSAVAGNGIAVSGATGAVTISAAAPSYDSVGSYCLGALTSNASFGNTNYAAGTGANQLQGYNIDSCGVPSKTNNFSGTWKAMNGSNGSGTNYANLFVRVS
jgi:hypothetical protein